MTKTETLQAANAAAAEMRRMGCNVVVVCGCDGHPVVTNARPGYQPDPRNCVGGNPQPPKGR